MLNSTEHEISTAHKSNKKLKIKVSLAVKLSDVVFILHVIPTLFKKKQRGYCNCLHPSVHLSLMMCLLPFAESFKNELNELFSYKRKYVHEVLVNCFFKFAQEKVWLGELTISP